MSIIKYIRRQDCNWKQAGGCSGETSLNLSNEILDYLTSGTLDYGEECEITFRIFRKDFFDAIIFIETQLPLYRSSSQHSERVDYNPNCLKYLSDAVTNMFGPYESILYTVTIYHRTDGRIYLKGLKQKGFTIRDFLVEYGSAIKFNIEDNEYCMHIISAVSQGDLD